MNMKPCMRAIRLLALLLATLALAACATAGNERSERALGVADEAIRVLAEIQQSPDRSIPYDLLRDAKAVAVIPQVVQAGLVFGARRGTGLMSVKRPDGSWSMPVYVSVTGGSIGFQAGITSIDLVFVIRTDDAVSNIVAGQFTLGGTAAAVAGPVGRDARAAGVTQYKAAVYSYSRAQGLFAGVAVDGTAITISDKDNAAIYGGGITPTRIIEGGVRDVPARVTEFRQRLTQYSRSNY